MKKQVPKKRGLTLATAKQALLRAEADRLAAERKWALEVTHKKAAYLERNLLIAALTRVFPAHLTPSAQTQRAWNWVVCVHMPLGQVSWHIPDDELETFAHLERLAAHHYDGHTIQEKWARLADLKPPTEH